MSRRYIYFPVKKKYRKFCDYMEYQLLSEKENSIVYYIPANHLCRFLINHEKWIEGTFNKEDFIKQTDI